MQRSPGLLEARGYEDPVELGRGKDGVVYRARREGAEYVVKELSDYGMRFLPMTRALMSAGVASPHLIPLRIVAERLHEYRWEPLGPVATDPASFLSAIEQLCDLECALLSRNLLLWDLGFSSPNYRLDREGRLRWIDYGGNAVLFVRPPSDAMPAPRASLIAARNDFVQCALLLHIAVWGLGAGHLRELASPIQDEPARIAGAIESASAALRGTIYAALGSAIRTADLLTPAGWRAVQRAAHEARRRVPAGAVLEPPDIERIWEEAGTFHVRGYQNYDLRADAIDVLDRGHLWANSFRKWQLVDGALAKLRFESFLDVGCNLGLYVFSTHVRYGVAAAGVDYNPLYVEHCRRIATRLGLACDFSTTSFSDVEGRYDCVAALGIIHHLYHRTEGFGGLDRVLERLASLTQQWAIVEVPTEREPKARKWTQLPGRPRREPYSLAVFLEHARRHFTTVEPIGSVSPERPVFLCGRRGGPPGGARP